jgi:HAE1 family hydrophobic/amphiphilic exporter-1
MEVDVFGQDFAQVTKAAHIVQAKLQGIAGLEGVDLGVQEATPMFEFNIDREEAASLGVTYSDIASAIDTATNGNLASYYQELGFQYPIYVQEPVNKRKTAEQILDLPITPSASISPAGSGVSTASRTILLRQVATPKYVLGPNQITRINRQRYIAVTGRVSQGRSDSEIQAQISEAMNGLSLGNGIYWDYGTNQKRRGEEFSGLTLAVFMAIALIYIVLASQFESYVYPLIVLCSVPLCAIGVVLALFLTGRNFGLTAFIGLLMLIGIAVKNGILLVDYTNQLRSKGMPRDQAILQAGPTRLRPILMTSSAAILGMLPLAMQIGKGSETEAPLATAVVGGLFTSTALTLFVVPVVYTLFDDAARRFRKNDRDLAPAAMIGPSVSATGSVGRAKTQDEVGRPGMDVPPVGREFNE